jgi:uncharacterized iron-regulated membrane protein
MDSMPSPSQRAESAAELPSASPQRLYARVWRWHFFAALIVIPFVLWQATTGVLYLWHQEIAGYFYPDQTRVTAMAGQASLESQLATVLRHQPREKLQSIEVSEDPARSTAFFFADVNGLPYPAFTNPHSGEYLGTVPSTHWLRGLTRGLHGGWPIKPWGSYLLELGACWAIVMTLTGLYLWWPRNSAGFGGVLYPRIKSGSRAFWRDLHAIVGVYFALVMLAFLFTALPWTTFWGNQVLGPIERATHQETPIGFFFAGGHDGHANHAGHGAESSASPALTLDDVVAHARAAGARGSLEIRPAAPGGVVTMRDDHPRAWDETYLQLDGRTGAVLTRVTWEDFPVLSRIVSLGVDLHEGHFFGRANQVFNTVVVGALYWLVVTGFIGWYRRRPNGGVSAPPKREIHFPRAVVAVAIALCIFMPLLGASVLLIALLDRLLGRLVPGRA